MSLLEDEYSYKSSSNNGKHLCRSIKLYFASFIACIASFVVGYSLQYSSPTIPQLTIPSAGNLYLSSGNTSLFASLLAIGAAGGALIGGKISDQLGRRSTLILSSIPSMAGWLLIAYATAVWHLLVGRTLCGIGVGISSLAVPIYLAEISTPDIRGSLLFLTSLLIAIGSLSCAALSVLVKWRYLAVIAGIPILVLAIGMILLPESPRFLVSQGRLKEAIDCLRWLHGDEANIYVELTEIEEMHKNTPTMDLCELFRPPLVKPFMIAIACMLFQQFTGFNAIYYYCTSIFNQAGFKDSLIVNLIANAVQLFATILAVPFIDRAGRKILLMISGAGIVISCGLFGLFFQLKESTPLKLDWLAIVSVVLFLMFFALGWSAIPWLLMSELLPTKARGIASSLIACLNWTSGFLVVFFFIDIEKGLTKQGGFWLFAGCTLASEFFIYYYLPETKGKTLEQIQQSFDPDLPIEEPHLSYGSDLTGGQRAFDKSQSWSINR
ncbi:Facilitated trehalose transporter Tret1-2-like protein [Trichoplax sp. H2]|nr:Facilitated trehalose transporter Tret1-2-like protein [Trichoplax sp. H2]|eukprot:RDD39540.1 Facilitated trehalose transporter Tret1-2-like protein [Trichoplax sp. H2]